ncbi:hypothetical protein, partial [Streptococcus sp. HMSC067A03]|uniref:hypothetical protein n=1 Tax=Streptococcus sp. HMSC067A03 TaxID=1739467 RepID=UPI001C9B489F
MEIFKNFRSKVLELCCFEWFQNSQQMYYLLVLVLELCCFEWFQNQSQNRLGGFKVLELCCFEWF